MPPATEVVIVDVCFLQRFNMLGKEPCALMMAEVISLHGSSYETDISELSVVDYCEEVIAECDFVDHGITDEQVLLWYSNLPTNQQQYLRKLFKDGADLKLLFRAKHVSGKAMLLSCDWRLLRACEKHGVSHACFKMAMLSFHRDQCESILDNKEFGTDAMRVIGGKDPFFHFDNTRRCHHCDQNGKCPARVF
ncbi:hypothetical protein [Thiolapillus sp.]|nr:hypothetical protein [Thiolapillus sp.]